MSSLASKNNIVDTTKTRLPAPMGSLLDRERTVSFQFEGELYRGFVGDTVASVRVASNRHLLSRSFKYHRPRGPFSMTGQDANTLVQLPDEPNVPADDCLISAGLDVTGQNYKGSLRHDRDMRLDKLSRFMPVGFYYRTFHKPKWAWKYWESFIRKKAGLGKYNLDAEAGYHDKMHVFTDVLVVGGGPAGLQAALTAAEAGAEVLLVEREPQLGGTLTYVRFSIDGGRAGTLLKQLVPAVKASDKIRVLCGATCNGWFADNLLPVLQGNRMYKVRAKECIVATGSFEQPAVFRNNDLPGIMLSSAALRLMHHYAVRPGQRAVILAGNDDGYLAALDLHDQGIEVGALVDMRAGPGDPELVTALAGRNIPLHLEHTVFEALHDKTLHRVTGVDVRRIVGRGAVDGDSLQLSCDLVCMSVGYMPVYQLLCQAGGRLSYDDDAAEFSISHLPRHLHMAGSVNGQHALDDALRDGALACRRALALPDQPDSYQSPTTGNTRKVNFPWPIFAHPKGKEFVDLDEDLHIRDIVNATRHGYRDIQLVKRFSTVGMGPSQGRYSALATARLVAERTQRTVSETGVTTARPPFAAETLAHIAGRNYEPYRVTPMHKRHVELGARMMPAGDWQRPAYYPSSTGVLERQNCLYEESRHVREKVGIIDVSTLGGIELHGPDAAEFMNRFYTFTFAKQPVGRTRYAIAINEQGVVVDDGVSCRLGENHFYVTATTSGVEHVFRNMLHWNLQWRLDVDIVNVTSAYAAVNIAGPLSRKVLEKVCTGLDLSARGFPFLEFREGRVGDAPVRLLRVGFVGELGYEIHVPTRYGEYLWDVLMEAGCEYDIRPFGVEAQRLLRLEKGHVIIGQDTDSMTHPSEINMGWAVSRKKPFFVGRRTVEILESQPLKRRLVGFQLSAAESRPLEGHLVMEDECIAGNVTSCEYSPTLNVCIGLAYTNSDRVAPGDHMTIRVEQGKEVVAEIVKLPFYDMENDRQKM